MKDGKIITGDNSSMMHTATSMVLHAMKHLAEIPAKIKRLPPYITDSGRKKIEQTKG